jgi:hypothetical protein
MISELVVARRKFLRAVPGTRRVRPRLVGELLIIVFLLRVYDLVKRLGDRQRSVGIANAGHVRNLERVLRLNWERSINHWANNQHALALLCSYWYQFAHESITLGVLAWLWWARPLQYRRARNALVGINVVGLGVFALFPVAPPRLLPRSGIVDSVAAAGFGTTHGGPVSPDQYAAMPSLHLAWASWTVAMLLLNNHRTPTRLLLCAYLPWMVFVVIATGNHYVLDTVAGSIVAAGALAASGVTSTGRSSVPGFRATSPGSNGSQSITSP